MDGNLVQEIINVLRYVHYSGGTMDDLVDALKSGWGENIMETNPKEVAKGFESIGRLGEWNGWMEYGNKSVMRSSLLDKPSNRMESIVRIKESKLRKVLRKVILEYGEDDAQLRQKLQNREKMIGRGIDAGTIGFNPNWDYDTKPAPSKKRGIMGDVIRQVVSRLKNHQIGEWMEAEATNNPNVIKITSGDMVVVVTNDYGEFTFEMKAPRKWRDKWQETCDSIDVEIDEVFDSLDDWVQTTEMMEMGEG